MKKILILLVVAGILLVGCEIESGYRFDIKPVVDEYNKIILALNIFIHMDHKGKEVESEKDLVMMYEKMDEIKTKFALISAPSDEAKRLFHQNFSTVITHTLNVLDNYKQKFRVQISINNIEEEFADVQDKLRIAQQNYRTAQTGRGKNTYREAIVTYTQERDTVKANLEETRARYIEILTKMINQEQFYYTRYNDIQKQGRTAVFVSLAPAPKKLVVDAEREKYFPANEEDKSINVVD